MGTCDDDVRFDGIIQFTFQAEGGLRVSNHPDDPGGVTKGGIADLRDGVRDGRVDADGDGISEADVAGLTIEQIKAIYRRDYWERYHCGDLPTPLGEAYFDFVVNAGPTNAGRVLQGLLKTMFKKDLVVDGVVGPMTRAAIDQTFRDEDGSLDTNGLEAFTWAYLIARTGYYTGLRAVKGTFQAFWDGWLNRVARLRDHLEL